MAVGEDFIDGMNLPLAAARRRTRPERRLEFRNFHVLPPHPPAGHAPGLTRQIIQRQLEGLEPAAEARGIDEAIGWWRGIRCRLGRWPQGCHPGIAPEEMDAWRILRVFYPALAQLREIFPRIEELEGSAWFTVSPQLFQ